MASSSATTIAEYINSLEGDRKPTIQKLHDLIMERLPDGFKTGMNYGMIGYYIPHSLYPDGYHVDPKLPLPFMALASQKNYIALYHMGLYSNDELLAWFKDAYSQTGMKLDMGASCIRFKNSEKIPYELIGELVAKVTPSDFIKQYETTLKKKRKKK
jgi:Domain of unknown function (DU1801)